MRATRIIWRGAGAHAPQMGDGTILPPRDGLAPVCAMCGEPGARWTSEDAFSDNFRPLTHINHLFPHAVEGFPVSLCAACTWCSKALRLRCAAFFAREDGVWFVGRRDLLSHLLDPPEPPFVACAPIYGMDHGGEANGWRAVWRGEPALPSGVDVLTRLQAKHVACYAETARSRTRYPLQWDDHTRVMVDVPLWRELAARLGGAASEMRGASVGVMDAREALRTLRAPMRAPMSVHRAWPALVRGLDRYARSPWWPLLTDLVPMPDAPPKDAPPPAPVSRPAPAPAPVAPTRGQLSLF